MSALPTTEQIRSGLVRAYDRYDVSGHIDIMTGSKRFSTGTLLNVSATGAAVKCFIHLEIGHKYTLISSEFGIIPCTVVRVFGGVNFGVQFDIDLLTEKRLANKLESVYGPKETNAA